MAQVKVDGKDAWEVALNQGEVSMNGVKTGATWDWLGDNKILLKPDGGTKQVEAELLSLDRSSKTMHIAIGGNRYEVLVSEPLDQLLEKMGMGAGAGAMQNKIKAPMPGLVVDVMATIGQEVAKDEPLLILEAMKMENVIKSPRDGVIKGVGVQKGIAIEKNTLLIEFES